MIDKELLAHQKAFERVWDELKFHIYTCGVILTETLKKQKKILLCGNGGSAADAQHIAAELVGRFKKERRALAAVALTTDTSALTAIANDYDFSQVFARQIEALGSEGDLLVAISTSGESENVLKAVEEAKRKSMRVIGLLGRDGGRIKDFCDASVVVPINSTARIQEMHILVAHIWCAMVDEAF